MKIRYTKLIICLGYENASVEYSNALEWIWLWHIIKKENLSASYPIQYIRKLYRNFPLRHNSIITSWTRSSQASWKWVPKRRPAPPWSVGSTEFLPKQTRNMDPPLFISCALALRNTAKSVWNCFLYAFAVLSLAPWMNTLPLL